MPFFKIADVVFEAKLNYENTLKLCRKYTYEGDEPVEFSVQITRADIEYERENTCGEDYGDVYHESSALVRKLNDYLLDTKKGMMFHSSALAVDKQGVLFTAQSGTGKSTHARLWREFLGDKVVMINDDKPILRFIDGKVFVCGTPWMGKHMIGAPIKEELKAVCEIKRSLENKVKKVPKEKMLFTILNQTVRPEDKNKMENLLFMVNELLAKTETYEIYCNQDISAAKVSYNAIIKGIGYED